MAERSARPHVLAEERWGDVRCPDCDRVFNRENWEVERPAGSDFGGSAVYSCPSDKCGGEVVVTY